MRYTIYGRENCTYCDLAKKLLDDNDLEYDYHDVMLDMAKQRELVEAIGVPKTVPQIFYGSHHIGGYTDLVERLQS